MEENEEITKKKEFNPRQKLVIWASVIILIFIIIVLGFTAYYSETFSLKWFFIVSGGAIFLFLVVLGVFYFPRLFSKAKEKGFLEGVPEPLSFGKCQEIVEVVFKNNYGNKIKNILEEGTEEHGKRSQSIYFIYFEGKFKDSCERAINYFFGLNMHYPERRKVIVNPTVNAMSLAKRRLAIDPEPAPVKEIIEEKSPLLGVERKITKTGTKKETKKQQKKEDLT